LALQTPPPIALPGTLTWRHLAPGLEIGELPALVQGEEVDRLFLTRVDPTLYEFQLLVTADKDLEAWMRDLRAVAVINGSYYSPDMGPATPVRINGMPSGPTEYNAQHGAFVSSPSGTGIIDLAAQDWKGALAHADTAFVSYPLLGDREGGNRAPDSRWLASRSFIAEDADGKIVLGSAPEGFFTLRRLAEFLQQSPLDFDYVLNLDGGPVACHGVSFGGVRRLIHGHVELQSDGDNQPLRVLPASRSIHALMPIVLAVVARRPDPGAPVD
jgi:hypothetical protein